MVALTSSLGLFAVVWLAFCVVSSALVTEAMLRSNDAGPNRAMPDGTRQNLGD